MYQTGQRPKDLKMINLNGRPVLTAFLVLALTLAVSLLNSVANASALTQSATPKPKVCNPAKSKPCGNSCIRLTYTCHIK